MMQFSPHSFRLSLIGFEALRKYKNKKIMANYESISISDTGVVRSNNEDYVLASPEYERWILADGVGGHEAGEVASELACNTIMHALFDNYPVQDAIMMAHDAIIDGIQKGIGQAGMATTIVVSVMDKDICHIFWVGDSRAYLIDKIGCSQLTVDHSLVQQLVDNGSITPEEAAVHPSKNIVYQVLGMQPPSLPEVAHTKQPLERGDIILLCSDGLSDKVSNEAIFNTLQKHRNLEKAAEDLINQAIDNGTEDNISVQLIRKLNESTLTTNAGLLDIDKHIDSVKNVYSDLITKIKKS
jgi:protein phosphatase